MPVLLMKAMEGFADRFQVLAHCIRYCKKHNTALCVDWSDGTIPGVGTVAIKELPLVSI
jgi:hypothetical protein